MISNEVKLLIKHFEGCSLKSYILPKESWATIGWGIAIPLKDHPKTITQDQADKLFDGVLDAKAKELNKLIKPEILSKLTQNQYDATLSFYYNSKPYLFKGSTFLKYLNDGRFAEASKQLPRWVYGEGKQKLPGLVRRRLCEKFIFDGGTIDQLKSHNWFMEEYKKYMK